MADDNNPASYGKFNKKTFDRYVAYLESSSNAYSRERAQDMKIAYNRAISEKGLDPDHAANWAMASVQNKGFRKRIADAEAKGDEGLAKKLKSKMGRVLARYQKPGFYWTNRKGKKSFPGNGGSTPTNPPSQPPANPPLGPPSGQPPTNPSGGGNNGSNSVTLKVNIKGEGEVDSRPPGIACGPGDSTEYNFRKGTNVLLNAKELHSDHPFKGWSGDKKGNSHELDIVMDGDKHVTAHFGEEAEPGNETEESKEKKKQPAGAPWHFLLVGGFLWVAWLRSTIAGDLLIDTGLLDWWIGLFVVLLLGILAQQIWKFDNKARAGIGALLISGLWFFTAKAPIFGWGTVSQWLFYTLVAVIFLLPYSVFGGGGSE